MNNISKSVKEHTAINPAIIDKPLTINTPPPRVETSIDETSILNMPPPRVVESSKVDREKIMLNPNRIKFQQHISNSANNRARIYHRHQMALRNNNQSKHAQLISDTDTGNYLNYRQLMRDPNHAKVWSESSANEFGQLAQGVEGRVTGTNTIFFIQKDHVPINRRIDVTYGSFVWELKPNKEEKHHTQLTAGGDRINYPEDVGTPIADMTLVKILLNSVISTKDAGCMTLDIKDFYLNTPMKRYKYMRLKLADIPEEIIEECKLREIVTDNSYVYCKIRKGMYSLPQAGLIAQELLEQRLSKVGYSQSKIIPGLWTHKTRQTCFTLVVDNFAIKFTKMEDAQHLIEARSETRLHDYNQLGSNKIHWTHH
jgi:hypothetical protein